MENFLVRLILGGSFFLLLIFSIILLFIKDNMIQLPKMHRYLGATALLTSLSLLYMYLELVIPQGWILQGFKLLLLVACIITYAFIGYKFFQAIFGKYQNTPAVIIPTPQAETPAETAEPEKEEVEEETEEEDDKNATDEEGNLIPEPSEQNIEDLIFFQKLEALMAKDRLFSDPEITREQVAMQIGTNRTYLIRSIKVATGKTFNEYITDLRVNYAATLLTTSDESLDYIGTIAGFRSKSVYYRAFAAANNCTPKEYRNRKNKGKE